MEQVGYQIVHSIAGRIRIRVPWLESDPQATSNYQRLAESLSGVKAVRINPLAQSIVVEYNPKALSLSKAEELLISAMQQVKLTPPAAAPTVDQPVDHPVDHPDEPEIQEQVEIEQVEIENEPFISTSTEPPLSSEHSSMPNSKLKQSVTEIPSPWDDEPSLETEMLETEMLETEISSQPDSLFTEPTIEEPEMECSDSVCSTASLAKRLKVTSQAITRRRTKLDFGKWTQAQDPEGIAWNYHESDRLFRPVSSNLQEKE